MYIYIYIYIYIGSVSLLRVAPGGRQTSNANVGNTISSNIFQ